MVYGADGSHHHHHQQQQQQAPQPPAPPQPQQPQPQASLIAPGEMTLEEMARRDRVRAAARERQRKHRRMIKERKMRELGLEMGGEMMGVDEGGYRHGDGQYPPVVHDMQPIPMPHEPPFPQTNLIGGQTFASTLLLSFSCAPLLKQHLLRTLNMTNDELASLEPVIAEAWDRWDHQVPFLLSRSLAAVSPPTAPHALCRAHRKAPVHAPAARRARQPRALCPESRPERERVPRALPPTAGGAAAVQSVLGRAAAAAASSWQPPRGH